LSVFLSGFFHSQILAQDNVGYYFQSKGGFLVAHRSAIAHLVRNNTFGFEIGIIKHKQSLSDSAHRFPALGFNLEYRNFGYNSVLGKAISFSHFFDTPLYQSHNFFIDFQYGMGLGYITKKYYLESNPTNNAIGSHFNAKVTLKVMVTKYFNRFSIGGGLEISHFSNGAITYPNLGLNLPSAFFQFGILDRSRTVFDPNTSYSYGGCTKHRTRVKGRLRFPGNTILLSSIFTVKQVRANPSLPKRYPVFGIRATYQKQLSWDWRIEGSIDLIHNESNLHVYPDSSFTQLDVLQIGLYAGVSYQFYKSEIVMGLGFYVRDKIVPLGRLYNKIGYRYYFTDNFYGLFNVRANLGKADFFEFGIGYKIKKW